MTARRVVVVGGGVIGTACAHYLCEAGAEVTVLDKGAVGSGCSHGNCGYVCPSHLLPLAGPGMIAKALRELLRKGSALKVRLRIDPGLWAWLARFALRCNRRDMLEAARALRPLLVSSRALYGELFRSGALEAEWQERGLLFVFRTPAEHEHYAETDRLLREEFDMPARRLDGEALTALEPALKQGLPGGWHYELDAHLRPDRLMASWRRLLLARGVEVREGCAFVGLERSGRLARAVVTTQGTLAADAVVVAAGAWAPLLRRHLRCRLPIQPGKGYSITTARPARCPATPVIFEEDRVAVTPFRDSLRVGSTMEFAGYDATLRRGRLDVLRRAARRYLIDPEGGPVQEEWWGWRPMVPDGKPIIGPAPAFDNVVIAGGHGMLGVSMAPATGKLVAELLAGAGPHLGLGPYSVSRF